MLRKRRRARGRPEKENRKKCIDEQSNLEGGRPTDCKICQSALRRVSFCCAYSLASIGNRQWSLLNPVVFVISERRTYTVSFDRSDQQEVLHVIWLSSKNLLLEKELLTLQKYPRAGPLVSFAKSLLSSPGGVGCPFLSMHARKEKFCMWPVNKVEIYFSKMGFLDSKCDYKNASGLCVFHF